MTTWPSHVRSFRELFDPSVLPVKPPEPTVTVRLPLNVTVRLPVPRPGE